MLNFGQSSLLVALASTTLIITGCNSDSDSSSGSDSGTDTSSQITAPETTQITHLQLTDIDFNSLQGVDLAIKNATQMAATSSHQPASTQFSDEQGRVQLQSPLQPGHYTFLLSKNSQEPVEVRFEVLEGNTVATPDLPVPVDSQFNYQETLAFGAISGVIYGEEGPLQDALVTLSGGAATNGVFRSAETNAQGHFKLTFNFQPFNHQEGNQQLLAALEAATLQASKAGFQSQNKTVNLLQGTTSGQNLGLPTVSQQSSQQAIWSDDLSSSQNFWTVAGGDQSAAGQTGWTRITSGHTISNNLWGTAVKPGQGDASQGRVPQPRVGNNAWWFGNPATGNFVGQRAAFSVGLDGGESAVDSIRGSLTSGDILLPASGDASLTFQTWWEIESVNPNQDGFDWMEVQVAPAGTNDFRTLARLNPLADPVSTLDRRPLPFSSGGFNQAPIWVQQEGISLNDYLGQSIQLRFVLDTQDELYNAFRGWVIDDLKILPKKGTHPAFQPGQGGWDDSYFDDEDWLEDDWVDDPWVENDLLKDYCANLAKEINENSLPIMINHYENLCGHQMTSAKASNQQPAAVFSLNPRRTSR